MQEGSPRELYTTPHTRFVAEFMGHSNLLPQAMVKHWMPDLLVGGQPEDAELFIRPERIGIRQAPDAEGVVVSTSFLGSIQRVQVLWRSQPLLVETSSAVGLEAGDRITLSFDAQDCAWVQA